MRGLAAIALTATALAGCGGSDEDSSRPAPVALDQPIQLADCTDWNEGSVDERLGSIREIEAFAGGPVPGTGGRGLVLDEEEAYDLFERACSNSIAQGFNLYKIYIRAAAFSGKGQ